jgi:hypothetical protein
MARIKDWLIDMESYIWDSYSRGMTLDETIKYVKSKMKNVDISYIENVYHNLEQ